MNWIVLYLTASVSFVFGFVLCSLFINGKDKEQRVILTEYCDECRQEITERDGVIAYHDSWFCSYDCLHDFIDEQSDEFDLGEIAAYE